RSAARPSGGPCRGSGGRTRRADRAAPAPRGAGRRTRGAGWTSAGRRGAAGTPAPRRRRRRPAPRSDSRGTRGRRPPPAHRGGSKGRGLAMARALAVAGAAVLICARHPEELEGALASILAGTGSQGAWFAADLADPRAVARLAEQVLGARAAIDILVNNAGIN